MKKPQPANDICDLIARLQKHDEEMSALRQVLDTQLIQIAQLQAEVNVLHSRESPDAPGSPRRLTDRQEVLSSAARGWMWQP